jgi:hypothetical protein
MSQASDLAKTTIEIFGVTGILPTFLHWIIS